MPIRNDLEVDIVNIISNNSASYDKAENSDDEKKKEKNDSKEDIEEVEKLIRHNKEIRDAIKSELFTTDPINKSIKLLYDLNDYLIDAFGRIEEDYGNIIGVYIITHFNYIVVYF